MALFALCDDPLLLLEREEHAEIGINWFLDQEIPKGGHCLEYVLAQQSIAFCVLV